MKKKNKKPDFFQKCKDFLLDKGYTQDQIVGIFPYEDLLFDSEPSTYRAIVIPSFKQFCLLSRPLLIDGYKVEDKKLEIRDIRLVRERWVEQDLDYLKLLFAKKYYINEKYELLFQKYFIKNKETIAHYNKQKTLKTTTDKIFKIAKQRPVNGLQLYYAESLYLFLKDYFEETTYEECLKARKQDDLWQLKYQLSEMGEDSNRAIEKAIALEKQTKKLLIDCERFESPKEKKAIAAINEGTIEIIKLSLKENIEPFIPVSISKKDFFNNLTATETKAYYAIISEIGCEGNIIVSDVVKKSSISRPVFASLFAKMKQYNVATIVNKGSGGTDIEITQTELKNEAKGEII